jgi:thiol-disulfide isomerase/thioredoxin
VTDWPGTLAAGYRAKLQTSPDDPVTLFLAGVSLLSKDPSQAVRDFDRAIAKDPRYPWPYFELMDVYANVLPDPAKLALNMRAYHDLCPANADAFRYLPRIADRDQTRTFAQQFRETLEKTTDARDLSRYKDLWAAEYRSTAPADFDQLRGRVLIDLKRLEPLGKTGHTVLEAVLDGYQLTRQTEAAAQAGKELRYPADPAEAHWQQFIEQYRDSQFGRTPEERRAYKEAHRKEAEDLVVKWPNALVSWTEMLDTSSDAAQARQAGEEVLRLAAVSPDPEKRWGAYDHLAASWLRYEIRLKDVPDIAEQAIRDLDRTEAGEGVIGARSPGEMQMGLLRALGRFEIWETLLNSSLRLGAIERASRVPIEMRAWLDAHPLEADTPRNVAGFYPRWQGFIEVAEGKVADAQDRKADALAYYQRVLIGPARQYPGGQVLARAQALWKELGGTEEGWTAWSKPIETKPAEPTTAKRARAPEEVASGWVKIDRSLADLSLSDLAGKTWTVADLKGKVTLVNVWASWCGPCTAELPHIQELYEKIKDRDDVQLITLSVDENPGLPDALLKKRHYTFPVLIAESYFAQVQPPLSIPRVWIADKSGTARLEKVVSSDPHGTATFVQDVLDQLKRP